LPALTQNWGHGLDPLTVDELTSSSKGLHYKPNSFCSFSLIRMMWDLVTQTLPFDAYQDEKDVEAQ
jgi:hypothetical protein